MNSFTGALSVSLGHEILSNNLPDKHSSYLKIEPDERIPSLKYFSIDSLGKGNISQNLALIEDRIDNHEFRYTSQDNISTYTYAASGINAWKVKIGKSSFSIHSEYHEGNSFFQLNISQEANHATVLGLINEDGFIRLPAIWHLPDRGTMRITCSDKSASVKVEAKRFIDHPYIKIFLPPASNSSHGRTYNFEVITIHPDLPSIRNDSAYDCFRKNFISIFQLNPALRLLANNSASDACAFTLYKYAEVAKLTPPLADGFTALDLIRATLDRYLAGAKGYGMPGYDYEKVWDIPDSATVCSTLDSYPSLIIAACIYITVTSDKEWFSQNYSGIRKWAVKMLSMDADGDGLLEFCLSGNSGSWKGDKTMRPANWWDTIGFGHKDAYSNALAYNALVRLSEVNHMYGSEKDAEYFSQKGAALKAVYTSTFYNPATGVLAGWKSADGSLHDYYFTFVNGVAIHYDLIENDLAHKIMDALLAKMKAAGFNRFDLGLPGNLIPVKRADYTDLLPEVGGGLREDNLDGFQIYENGGATACFTYFTIHALQKLGRTKDADAILKPLLKSMSAGNFQGRCSNGKTKDWRSWSGECWGYEGFLVDNYLFLLAVLHKHS